jgi:hypothetical protein
MSSVSQRKARSPKCCPVDFMTGTFSLVAAVFTVSSQVKTKKNEEREEQRSSSGSRP